MQIDHNDESNIRNEFYIKNSNVRAIACENGIRNKEDDFSNMADGRHVGFGK